MRASMTRPAAGWLLGAAATGFLAFLRSPEARIIIEKYGYVLAGQS